MLTRQGIRRLRVIEPGRRPPRFLIVAIGADAAEPALVRVRVAARAGPLEPDPAPGGIAPPRELRRLADAQRRLVAIAAAQESVGSDLYGGVYTLGPWVIHPLALLFVLSGSLMVSKTLHIPKL